jgi:antitoxin component YwqK of YwqJK toxin-antitoxin module
MSDIKFIRMLKKAYISSRSSHIMIQKGILALACCLTLQFCCTAADQNLKREAIGLAQNIKITVTPTGNIYKAYWPDKSLMAEGPVSSNKKNGLWKLFFKGTNGTSVMAEVPFKDDLIDGKVKEYYPSGRPLSESDYKNGILNGRHLTYYESGIGKIEEYFKDGRKNGRSFEYFEDGKTKENAYFQNNLRSGMSTIFYANGRREAIGRYIDGKKNGKWELFDEDGALQARGMYKDDRKTGTWTIYNRSGKVEEKKYD